MIEENSPLSRLGLPNGLEQLDAAMVWGKNKKTYFFRLGQKTIDLFYFLKLLT